MFDSCPRTDYTGHPYNRHARPLFVLVSYSARLLHTRVKSKRGETPNSLLSVDPHDLQYSYTFVRDGSPSTSRLSARDNRFCRLVQSEQLSIKRPRSLRKAANNTPHVAVTQTIEIAESLHSGRHILYPHHPSPWDTTREGTDTTDHYPFHPTPPHATPPSQPCCTCLASTPAPPNALSTIATLPLLTPTPTTAYAGTASATVLPPCRGACLPPCLLLLPPPASALFAEPCTAVVAFALPPSPPSPDRGV